MHRLEITLQLSPLAERQRRSPNCAPSYFSLFIPEIVPQVCLNCAPIGLASTVPQVTYCPNCATVSQLQDPSNFMPQLCPNCAREFSILCPKCAINCAPAVPSLITKWPLIISETESAALTTAPPPLHTNSRRTVTSQNHHIWKWIDSFIHIWQIHDVTNRQLFA